MINVEIRDSGGTGEKARVLDKGLLVTLNPSPPIVDQKTIPFRQFFTDTGKPTGSRDMLVDGSVTNIDFTIPASQENIRYITSISWVIADAGASFNKFGNIAALTNGCSLFYSRAEGEIVIHDELKTNFDFIRLSQGNPSFGSAADAFRGKNIIGMSEGYIPILDLAKLIPPFGIALNPNTQERITFRIRDDVSGIDEFDAIAYGFERLK